MGALAAPTRQRLLLLGLPLWAAGALGPALACAAQPTVRVLLMEPAGAVRVEGSAGSVTIAPAPQGLRVDARDVGDVWRIEGDDLRAGDRFRVRGALEVRRTAQGLRVVNEVALEDYVVGTLGREIYSHWSPEALKAQAVVTRTYALLQRARHARRSFHLRAGTAHQVYGGLAAETPATASAVAATRGEYLAYRGEPIEAVFHSASGGRTASAEEVWGRPVPYLVSMEVEGEEDSPDTYWRAAVAAPKLGRALAPLGIRVGPVRELRVVERSRSGRARRVQVDGPDGSATLEARDLRAALGATVIRSTLFEIRPDGEGFVFVGSGHGHGVGMSQWGAQAMAQAGVSYRDILDAFYPGTSLVEGGAP